MPTAAASTGSTSSVRPVHFLHAHARALRNRLPRRRGGAPQFAVHQHHPRRSRVRKATGSVTSPSSPIISSLPVASFHGRDRRTNRIRKITITANGIATPSAALKLTPMPVKGDLHQHQRAQHHGDHAADAENAVRRIFRLQNEKRQR